jgi:hypothetical protein
MIPLTDSQRKFLEHIRIHGQYKHRWPANVEKILRHNGYYTTTRYSGSSSDLDILIEIRSGYIEFLKKHNLKYPYFI